MKDYYQILGINRNASDEEIRSAFRKLAMKHHPDRGGDGDRFKEINEAYSILGDPEKRRSYNNPQAQFGGFNFSTNQNPFQDFFEHARRNARQTHARLTLWITLRDVALGGERTVTIGNTAGVTGAKIDIPLGINDGDHVQYPRLGPGGSDLVVTYRISPHDSWQRQNLNLKTSVSVSIWTLITGGDTMVTDIIGKEYRLIIPAHTQPGTVLKLSRRGLRNKQNQIGDLLVEILAHLPESIDPMLLEAIKKYS